MSKRDEAIAFQHLVTVAMVVAMASGNVSTVLTVVTVVLVLAVTVEW